VRIFFERDYARKVILQGKASRDHVGEIDQPSGRVTFGAKRRRLRLTDDG
jgi:hypothetical protein